MREVAAAGLCLLHLVPICIQSSVLSPRHAWSPPLLESFSIEKKQRRGRRGSCLLSSSSLSLSIELPSSGFKMYMHLIVTRGGSTVWSRRAFFFFKRIFYLLFPGFLLFKKMSVKTQIEFSVIIYNQNKNSSADWSVWNLRGKNNQNKSVNFWVFTKNSPLKLKYKKMAKLEK